MLDNHANRLVHDVTTELNAERLVELDLAEADAKFDVVPSPAAGATDGPVWRVCFDLAYDARRRMNLEINGEVVLGRCWDDDDVVPLDAYDADELGVSRRHASLYPTQSQLFVVDLGSTNGTRINGRSIGVHTPYRLSNGDLLTLGRLEFFVRIVERPASDIEPNLKQRELVDFLLAMGKSLTAHLDLDEVLDHAVEITMSFLAVDEASIWLVDEQTNELVLKAERGFYQHDSAGMRLTVSETLAGKVVRTGEPVSAHREASGDPIKVKTGYLVEAVMYVPILLGGIAIGVLSAAHRETGRRFAERDLAALGHIADFAAVAVQNARLYSATSKQLERLQRVVTALGYALSYDVKNLLNNVIGYTGLLDIYAPLNDDTADLLNRMTAAGHETVTVVDQLVEITKLTDTSIMVHQPCDLLEAVERAVEDRQHAADDKQIALGFEVLGKPYAVFGDRTYLYRAALNLIDNAVRYSPHGAAVDVTLAFGPSEITIRVCDTGPGIPEEYLPHLFSRYFRGKGTAHGKPGIGLGLEIVRTTVEAHRGWITTRNREGGGAEFVFSLPGTLKVP